MWPNERIVGGRGTVQIQVVRYAIARGPLPPVTHTLEVGELARQAVLSQFAGAEKRSPPPLLSGHNQEGPLQDGHRHSFYLPTDENRDGLLDHLIIYSPGGFGSEELDVLGRLRGLYQGDGRVGWPLELLALAPATVLEAEGGLWQRSDCWESVTPMVLPRYPKQYRDGTPKLTERGEQRDGPEDQARREWVLRQQVDPDLPDLVHVQPVPACWIRGRELSWRQFQVTRRWGSGASSGLAYGLFLRFAAPVAGPVALGFGCHFGLGLFRPVRDRLTWAAPLTGGIGGCNVAQK